MFAQQGVLARRQAAASKEQSMEGGGEEGEEERWRDVHALTYVLSIEISLTVTVLCREANGGGTG